MNALDPTVRDLMHAMGEKARKAAAVLAFASTEAKNIALVAAADAVMAEAATILAANAEDVAGDKANGISAAFLDRLSVTPARLAAVAQGLRDIAALPDPVGTVMAEW